MYSWSTNLQSPFFRYQCTSSQRRW